MDLVKACLIGAALTAAILAIPVILAFMIPIAIFLIISLATWFFIRICRDEDPPDPD